MEVIRKKICLDDFRSHICGALNCVSGTANNVNSGNFGGFVYDADAFDISGWTGYSGITRTTEMMRRYNVLLDILRRSTHVKHAVNLSCKDNSNTYFNKFYLEFDYTGSTEDFFFKEKIGVLPESDFTYYTNYYTYNGNENDTNYDYLILISDEDLELYNRYFGFGFVQKVHEIIYSGDSRFNVVPYVPVNVLLTHSFDDLGLMSLYEDEDLDYEIPNYSNDGKEKYGVFPMSYSNGNKYDWFEKSGFTRYITGPEPGTKAFTEDERPSLESKLTTLRDKIYIQDDNGKTLPAIFEDFDGTTDESNGKFFKAIFYTGASASDGVYETKTKDGVTEVVTNTTEEKPWPINSNVYYIITSGEADITTSDWTDDEGYVHHKVVEHCDEYRWWEVIPTDVELVCADDEDVPANVEKYRTQTVFETLKNVIMETPASNGDYYYFLVKYDNMPDKPARIPYTVGQVFNKDVFESGNTKIYSADKILNINIYTKDNSDYIEFTYVLGGIFNGENYTSFTGGTIYNENYAYFEGREGEIDLDGYTNVSYWYNYIDFDGAKEEITNREFNLSRQANMSEVSEMTTENVWRKDGSVYNSPIFKEDFLMGITKNGVTDIEVDINRGNASAFEKHFRLSECNSFDDIETNGNGGFFSIE